MENTIKAVAEMKAHEWGYPNDYALKQRIERMVLPSRATIIQRRFDQTHRFPSALLQTIKCSNIEPVKGLSVPTYKTKDRVPKPLVVRDSSYYTYVGVNSGDNGFDYIPQHQIQLLPYRKFGGGRPFYYDLDGYLYVGNVVGLRNILIRGVFDDPVQAIQVGEQQEDNLFIEEVFVIENSLMQGIMQLLEERRIKLINPDEVTEVSV